MNAVLAVKHYRGSCHVYGFVSLSVETLRAISISYRIEPTLLRRSTLLSSARHPGRVLLLGFPVFSVQMLMKSDISFEEGSSGYDQP